MTILSTCFIKTTIISDKVNVFKNLLLKWMRGNAKRDGCPLRGSVSPPSECYWLVNASPSNYGRSVAQNSGPILAVCGPKYIELSVPVPCAWSSVATPFSDWRCLVAFRRNSRSSREVVRNREFDVFGPPNFEGKGLPNVSANFTNLGHHRPCGTVWWRSAKRLRRLAAKNIMKDFFFPVWG